MKKNVKPVSEKNASALTALVVVSLKDLYGAHVANALPKLSKAVTSKDLKAAFDLPNTETQTYKSSH